MKRNVSGCPVESAMNMIGGRWRAVIAFYLLDGPQRFSELRRCIPRISQRMLTQDLRELERAGLVSRTVYAEVPVRVEYTLTLAGEELRPVISALCDWGKRVEARAAEVAAAAPKARRTHLMGREV